MTTTYYQTPYVIRANHAVSCVNRSIGNREPFTCTEPDHCKLVSAHNIAAGRYEAFTDGAIGYATISGRTIEQTRYQLSREYDRTSAELIAYRRAH